MKKLIEDIVELHNKMGVSAPRTTNYNHSLFRMKFLLEELMETIDACGLHYDKEFNDVFYKIKAKVNEEEVLDGLVDLMVVIIGTAHFFGYTNKIKIEDCKFSNPKCAQLNCTGCPHEPPSLLEHAWNRVHAANMAKVPVKSAKESKRGSPFDLLKPEGWKKPTFDDLFKQLKERTQNEVY